MLGMRSLCGARIDGVKASYRSVTSGTWDGPATISEAGQEERAPNVEFDGAGNAVAIWIYRPWSGSTFAQAAFRPAGGAWRPGAESLCAEHSDLTQPDLAITPAGAAAAVDAEPRRASSASMLPSSPPACGAWNPAQTISGSGVRASSPYVAVDPAGDAVAT